MEIKVLYVLEVKGEKHYYGKECDRNHAFNILTKNGTFAAKKYEISLENFVEKN